MISVIIPTLNEENALPATLNSLVGQTWIKEICIVDGGSDDETLSVISNFSSQLPQLKTISALRGRGSQMNAGTQATTGEWLLFLHADTLLPRQGIKKIYEASRSSDIFAGCFQQKFSGRHWGLRLISWLHNSRGRITKIMYGDQAIFIKRSLFHDIGGFPEQTMEDVLFSEKLLKRCMPLILNLHVTTDSRKFQQMGVWRALWQVVKIQSRHRRGKLIGCVDFFHHYR